MLLELEASQTDMGSRQMFAARMLVLIVIWITRARAKLVSCVNLEMERRKVVLTSALCAAGS